MSWIHLAAVLLGSFLVSFYVGIELSQRKMPDLGKAVLIFLAASGIVAGIKVIILSFLDTIPEGDKLYVFVGGVAVMWVSITSMGELLQTVIEFYLKKENADKISKNEKER
ncbi:membrane protein [Beggiatoa sp. PS]|nr:membrane protein [Beggiatoa sp. PS]